MGIQKISDDVMREKLGGFNQPRQMYEGTGPLSTFAGKIGRSSQPELAGQNSSMFDLSGVKETLGNVWQGIKNWDERQRYGAPTPSATIGVSQAQAAPVKMPLPSYPSGPVGLPSTIAGRNVVQSADGSGVIQAPVKIARSNKPAGIRRQPTLGSNSLKDVQVDAGLSSSTTAGLPMDAPEVAGYGEYADGTSRLYAQKAPQEMIAAQQMGLGQQPAQVTPVDMSPGSQGEWEANQKIVNRISALSPDMNMTPAQYYAYRQGVKNLGTMSEANYKDAATKNFGDENAVKIGKLGVERGQLGINQQNADTLETSRKDTAEYQRGQLGLGYVHDATNRRGQDIGRQPKIMSPLEQDATAAHTALLRKQADGMLSKEEQIQMNAYNKKAEIDQKTEADFIAAAAKTDDPATALGNMKAMKNNPRGFIVDNNINDYMTKNDHLADADMARTLKQYGYSNAEIAAGLNRRTK